MKGRALLLTWAVIAGWPSSASAALTVDPPQPITRRVTVQIIETALTNGTSPATIFGDAAQRASIEAGIDSIWAQAGIDIAFLSTVTRYNNTFAYQGNGGARPTNDLDEILTYAAAAGKMNPTTSVVNIFFVNVVPGFSFTSEWTANGIANVGADGIAAFVGDNLLPGNRDVIAGVIAHEIGHNLGLYHAASGSANLMSSQDGTTAQLTAAQISAVFQTTFRNDSVAYIPSGGTGFPQLLPANSFGDYNHDGTVNAADYAVWRSTMGSTANLAADGNGNGSIDDGDYTVWRTHFGTTSGAGQILASANPEPATWVHMLATVAVLVVSSGGMLSRRRRVSMW